MDHQEFVPGARVLGEDGEMIGTLEATDATSEPTSLVVRLLRDERLVRIPWPQIDRDRSTDREVVTTIPGAGLLDSHAPSGEDRVSEGTAGETRAVPGEDVRPDHLSVSLAGEEMVAHTRDVERGRVVIRKRVESVPHEETIEIGHDEVDVERVAVNRAIDEVPAVRHEGDTMIVPVVEEVLVVEKRLRLVEEVRVTRRRVTESTTIRDELRREVVDISADPEQGADLRQ